MAGHHEAGVLTEALERLSVAECLPATAPEAPVVAPSMPSLKVAAILAAARSLIAADVENAGLVGAIPADVLVAPGANA